MRSQRDPAIVRPVLFKCSRYSLVLAGLCLPYRMLCAYLVRLSYMFCLTCGSFLAGTAFFILCGPIFVYTYGGLKRIRFIRQWAYAY